MSLWLVTEQDRNDHDQPQGLTKTVNFKPNLILCLYMGRTTKTPAGFAN